MLKGGRYETTNTRADQRVMEDWSVFMDFQVRRFIAPKRDELVSKYYCEIWSDTNNGTKTASSEDPALALFWAIHELMK